MLFRAFYQVRKQAMFNTGGLEAVCMHKVERFCRIISVSVVRLEALCVDEIEMIL
jgi:hypothetical protein